MSDQQGDHKFDPDNLLVDIGGKKVPFNKINKPHSVLIDPIHHHPKVDSQNVPEVKSQQELKQQAEQLNKKNE